VCASLSEAHARGLIHRDIKPPNVFLTERGGQFDFVKVLDFGLVKDIGEDVDSTHELAGTPLYIAPERVRDPQSLDPRSDIYSVGVIAFNLLTGKQPFEASTFEEIAQRTANTVAPRVSQVAAQAIPPELDELVADCLAMDVELRPANAEAVLARLGAIRIDPPWDQHQARRWWAVNGPRLGAGGHELGVSAARAEPWGAKAAAKHPAG
jgi:serine/threonine-protein kinase